MTQQDKDLLKDLCARLPYKVKGHRIWTAPLSGSPEECDTELDTFDIECFSSLFDCGEAICKIDGHVRVLKRYSFKPYLRRMSSMTEEEISDLQKINSQFCFNTFDNFAYVDAADDGFCSVEEMSNILNYLNSHHFDYRELIEKGLALEAPEGMYNLNEN